MTNGGGIHKPKKNGAKKTRKNQAPAKRTGPKALLTKRLQQGN